jgi:nucleoside 2-deoxyribosyltransferase
MNIYFSCSITGGRQDQQFYHRIVQFLLENGHQVPTAHLSHQDVMQAEKVISPRSVYERDMQWLEECDGLIAEISTPSHGVGYEIALALTLGKPTFCCYQLGCKVSKILLGNTHPNLRLHAYHAMEDLLPFIQDFLMKIHPGDIHPSIVG